MPTALGSQRLCSCPWQTQTQTGLLQALGLSTTSCGPLAHRRLPSPVPWGKQRPCWGLGQTLWSSSATYGQTWGVDFEQLGRKEAEGLLSPEAQVPWEGLIRAQEVQLGGRLMLPRWARREVPGGQAGGQLRGKRAAQEPPSSQRALLCLPPHAPPPPATDP